MNIRNGVRCTLYSLEITISVFTPKACGQIQERTSAHLRLSESGSPLEQSLVDLGTSWIEGGNVDSCQSLQNLQFGLGPFCFRDSTDQSLRTGQQRDSLTVRVPVLRVFCGKSQK